MSSPPDTVNRRLLEGARRHDRKAVFARGDGSGETPDWRADRHAIRIALALGELGVRAGDVIALRMPLGLEWPLVERAVWALGATSLPLTRHIDPPASVRATVGPSDDPEREVLGFGELLEHGGVLDTPERATRLRAAARDVAPDVTASLESELEPWTQADWARAIDGFLAAYPPRDARQLLSGRLDFPSRLVLYAGWADGRTRTVLGGPWRDGALKFGHDVAGEEDDGFARLSAVTALARGRIS